MLNSNTDKLNIGPFLIAHKLKEIHEALEIPDHHLIKEITVSDFLNESASMVVQFISDENNLEHKVAKMQLDNIELISNKLQITFLIS